MGRSMTPKRSALPDQAEPGARTETFTVTEGTAPGEPAVRLPRTLTVSTGPAETIERTHLDTFDWRLWRAGAEMVVELGPNGRLLRWRPAAAGEVALEVEAPPRRRRDLPPGTVAREVGPRLGVRALLPAAVVRMERRCITVTDRAGKTVARVWWEHQTALDPRQQDGPGRTVVRVEGLLGYEAERRAVAAALARTPGLELLEGAGELEWAAAARGRTPGDYTSRIDVPMTPETTAAEAMRAILAHLRGTAAANVGGTVGDLDPEFLHDLRVAVRRARSAMGQLRGAYEPDRLESLREELRWVGAITGPCRDLDVFLLDLEDWAEELGEAAGPELEPLAELVRQEQAAAHRMLAAELRSARFRKVLAGWRRVTARPWRVDAASAPEAERDALTFGAQRIQRAYRRMRKRGEGLDEATPAAVVHRLRIDGKKLRYLLEFFSAVLGAATPGLVKQLRALQDELGAFNDLAVQQARLEQMARKLHEGGAAGAETLLLAGRLGAMMEARQQERRRAVEERLDEFFARPVRREVSQLGAGADKAGGGPSGADRTGGGG